MKMRLRNTVPPLCFTPLLRDHLDLIILSNDCQIMMASAPVFFLYYHNDSVIRVS